MTLRALLCCKSLLQLAARGAHCKMLHVPRGQTLTQWIEKQIPTLAQTNHHGNSESRLQHCKPTSILYVNKVVLLFLNTDNDGYCMKLLMSSYTTIVAHVGLFCISPSRRIRCFILTATVIPPLTTNLWGFENSAAAAVRLRRSTFSFQCTSV